VRSEGRLALWLLLSPALLWLTLLIVLPHVDMVILALSERVRPRVYEFGFGNFAEFFKEPLYWHTFGRTVAFSLLATLATFLVAFPTAYYIAKLMRGRAKSLAFIACLLPFWVSELVRTLGWIILLRETGVVSTLLLDLGITGGRVEFLYNDAAILVGLVYSSLLFMVVPLVTSLDTLDDSMIEAGYDLGGNGFDVLREIVVPHAVPGILSGSIVVFMLTLGNYVTPTLLGGKNSLWFTEQIYNQFITRFNWQLGSAFGILLLVASSGIVWAGLKLSRQSLGTVIGR